MRVSWALNTVGTGPEAGNGSWGVGGQRPAVQRPRTEPDHLGRTSDCVCMAFGFYMEGTGSPRRPEVGLTHWKLAVVPDFLMHTYDLSILGG